MKSFANFPMLIAVVGFITIAASGCDKAEQSETDVQTGKAQHETDQDHAQRKEGGGHNGTSQEAHAEGKGALKLSADEMSAAGIKVEALQEQTAADLLSVTATIQANQDRLAHVSPRVSGRIVHVLVALGARVKQGQALAVLDSIELGEAGSAFRQAQSEATLALANFKRAEELNEELIIAQKDYLQARAEHQKAQAALRAAQEKLRLLGATPGADQDSSSRFALLAPFAGSVIEKHAILGELGDPAQSLFTVADLSVVWIEASVFEQDLGKVRLGAKASVSVAAYPGENFGGKVAYIGNVMDKETRTVKARIEVSNTDERLKPGMFATAFIHTAEDKTGLFIPEEAVTLIQGLPTVFIQDEDGFEGRPVELGEKRAGRVAIKSGLASGDRVVTSGTYALKARMLKSQMGEGHAH